MNANQRVSSCLGWSACSGLSGKDGPESLADERYGLGVLRMWSVVKRWMPSAWTDVAFSRAIDAISRASHYAVTSRDSSEKHSVCVFLARMCSLE